jgi:decaprenylphospho-beta-D-ribofuranose 2-oxidase
VTTDRQRRRLSGWGRTAPTYSDVASPRDAGEVAELLASGSPRGVIARGLGRSYGDAAQRAGGLVLDMTRLDSIGEIDPASGLVTVGAGVSIDALLGAILPSGWFVPVTPGTRRVTIGGAIATDIHGKNHHRDGSFCSHVTAMTVVTPSGPQEVTPEGDPELFWATAGGMGLTGMVTEATVRLLPVESSWITVDTHRFTSLELLMAEMQASDHLHHYSVAWLDCNAGGSRGGRSILTRGAHASRDRVAQDPSRPFHPPVSSPRLRIPRESPKGLLNGASVAAFNELWFRRAPKERLDELQGIGTYFHPLDGIADWNFLYGPHGFLQYQFAVGDDHTDVVREVMDLVRCSHTPSFFAVLKRFGPGNPGPLSFPTAGWTLALDFPIGPPALPTLLDRLDDLVIAAGGRVYLAKDSRLRADRLHAMYPRLPELESLRRRIDPEGILRSDLSLRLGI